MRLIVGGAYQGKLDFALRMREREQSVQAEMNARDGHGDAVVTQEVPEREKAEADREIRVLDGATCTTEDLRDLRDGDILNHFHLLVRRMIEGEIELTMPVEEMIGITRLGSSLAGGPAVTIIANELGCGVVPVDPVDRAWRERTGRMLCDIAEQAQEVWRVVAGVGMRIK